MIYKSLYALSGLCILALVYTVASYLLMSLPLIDGLTEMYIQAWVRAAAVCGVLGALFHYLHVIAYDDGATS